MKPILKNVAMTASGAVIGGLAVVAAFKFSPELRSKFEKNQSAHAQNEHRLFADDFLDHSLFDHSPFEHNDPFAEMKKMREQMAQSIDQFEVKPRSLNEISQREDDSYIYYDIKVDDVKSTSINTKVEDGYITITGTQEKGAKEPDKKDLSENQSSQSYFSSTFSRTFPLPENVDANKMEMVTDKDKIVLKFPKSRV